jgi:alkylhydroperoxidase family enzyme
MHTKDDRANGESERTLYTLSARRETPFFTARERAALAWAEAITLISEEHAPDQVYEEVRQQLAIGFRAAQELTSRRQRLGDR